MLSGKKKKLHIRFITILTTVLIIVNATFIVKAIISSDEQCLFYMSILAGILFFSGLISYSLWMFYYKQDNPAPTFFELRLMRKTGTNKKADLAYDITKFFVAWYLIEFLFMAIYLFIIVIA